MFADNAASKSTKNPRHGVARLLRRVVHATLDRLTMPERNPSPEVYRFPWF